MKTIDSPNELPAVMASPYAFAEVMFAWDCSCKSPKVKSKRSGPSVLSQKFANKVSQFRAAVPQPRQGRKMVAQGASPGGTSPHPAFGTPLPRGRERGQGRGRVRLPTADAVGYPLSPRQVGADFINELLTHDTGEILNYELRIADCLLLSAYCSSPLPRHG